MENNYGYVQEAQEKKGSIIGGIIGALAGAAIGAVAWTLVGMMGYIASIIGFVIAFLADKGYDLLKGRQGVIKMIVLIVCVVLAVCAGTLGTAVWQIHDEYTAQVNALTDIEKKYYEIMPEGEFMVSVLSESEVQQGLIKDSAMGLLFGILGSFGLIAAAKNGKQQKAAPVQTETFAFDEAALEPVSQPQHIDDTDNNADKEVQA